MLYRNYIKRFSDFCIALTAFLILLPLFLIVAIVLTIANGGKPFFFQPRPGIGGKVFKVIKFKTMTDRRDGNGDLLPDGERLTAVGLFFRRTSLDEIPQLLNVIKGDMSLAGPRPLMVEYLPYYTKEQMRRHDIRPGITGWAQVNGRNAISWSQKFDLDVYYVDNLSFALDFKIYLLTLNRIFDTSNISPEGHATMPKFSDEMKNNLKQTT